MAPDLFFETASAFLDRRPFKPFTIVLVNGRQIQVDHPKAIAVRDGAGFFWAPGSVPVIFDAEGVNEFGGELMTESTNSP